MKTPTNMLIGKKVTPVPHGPHSPGTFVDWFPSECGITEATIAAVWVEGPQAKVVLVAPSGEVHEGWLSHYRVTL